MLFVCVLTVLNEMNSMPPISRWDRVLASSLNTSSLSLAEVGREGGQRSRCSARSGQACLGSLEQGSHDGSGIWARLDDRSGGVQGSARAAAGSPVAWAAMLSATWACAISTGPLPR